MSELFLEGHDQLDDIEAVGFQVVDKAGLFRDLVRIGVEMVDYDLANTFKNFRHL